MKIAVSSVCWMRKPLEYALTEARMAGFTAFEPLVFPAEEIFPVHGDLRRMTAGELKGRLEEFGMTPAGLHLGGFITGNAGRQRAFTDYVKRAADTAEAIGCGMLVATGPGRAEEPFGPVLDMIEESARYIEGMTVRIGLENHYGNWFQFIEDYRAIFQRVDAPGIGITLDTGHFTSSQVDPAAVLEQFPSRIFHVHIKDHIGTRSVRLGEGRTDNGGLVKALAAGGYSGYLVQELEVEDEADADAAARDGFAYMQQLKDAPCLT